MKTIKKSLDKTKTNLSNKSIVKIQEYLKLKSKQFLKY
jgi:hypothetical protein